MNASDQPSSAEREDPREHAATLDPATADRAAEAPGDVRVYDFRRPARISKDRMRPLQAIYEVLAKSFESWTTGRMRTPLEVELESVEQVTFGELQLALPSPCASYVLDLQGTGRQGLIDFGRDLAYFIVDRLFGGVGPHTVPDRTLSAIERMAVRIVADRIAAQLAEAWKDYVQLSPAISGFESIPGMLQVANREDPVLVAKLGVDVEATRSSVMLVLPFVTVEKFFTGTSTRRKARAEGSEEERARERSDIETTLREARLLVQARFPTFTVDLAELAALEPGRVLRTALTPDAALELIVAGQRRFSGAPGRAGGRLAVRISGAAEPRPDQVIDPERSGPRRS